MPAETAVIVVFVVLSIFTAVVAAIAWAEWQALPARKNKARGEVATTKIKQPAPPKFRR